MVRKKHVWAFEFEGVFKQSRSVSADHRGRAVASVAPSFRDLFMRKSLYVSG